MSIRSLSLATSAQETSRGRRWVYVLLAALALIMVVARFDRAQVGANVDDAQYIVMAESLASGRGLRLVHTPSAPRAEVFPYGWPLLLAPWVKVMPGRYESLRIVSAVAWLLSLAPLIALVRRWYGWRTSAMMGLLAVMNPYFSGAATSLMSEAAYICFTMYTLWLVDREIDRDVPRSGWVYALAGILAAYAASIRMIGVALIAASLVLLAFRRRYHALVSFSLAAGLGMIPLVAINMASSGGVTTSAYQRLVFGSGSIAVMLERAWLNAQDYAGGTIALTLLPILLQGAWHEYAFLMWAVRLANILLLAMVCLGSYISVRERRLSVVECYVAIYLLGLLPYGGPYVDNTSPRYVLPIIPLLIAYLARGWQWLAGRSKVWLGAKSRWISCGGLVGLLILYTAWSFLVSRNPIRERTTDLHEGNVWIAEHAPADAVVASPDPIPAYLYARRLTVDLPREEQDVGQYLVVNNVDYVVIGPRVQSPKTLTLDARTAEHVLPYIQQNPSAFDLVYENAEHNVQVYQFSPQP